MTLHKDRSIVELIEALHLDEKGWTVTDHWDGDVCAIGIASKSRPNRLIYVSTFDLPPGRYCFECEVGEAAGDLPYSVADFAADVDLTVLERKMIDYLGIKDATPDSGQQKSPHASVKV